MKKILIVALILIGILYFSKTKIIWNSRDELGDVRRVSSCSFYGLWNQQFNIQLVVSKKCAFF